MPETPAAALPPLRDVLARHGIRARRNLGQNFLLDLNLTARIARAAGPLAGITVLEVGPGPGGLTRALLDAGAAKVVAIERDPACVAALAELQAVFPGRLQVIAGDALKTDVAAIMTPPYKIVANLPYNIATALLTGWLDQRLPVASYTLMFQKEVAERLAASPRSKAYGRLSVLAQWHCEAERLFDIPARAFTPPPKVTSSVVQLTPRPEPLAPADPKTLAKITAAAFGQRRKMLRQSLKAMGGEALLADVGIDPTRRAEELTVAEFCALARAYVSRI